MNLEYSVIDSQGFFTDDITALEEFFGHDRILSKEFPCIRYRAAKFLEVAAVTPVHDLIPTKLAARVWDHLMHYKKKLNSVPQTETCELLILDRSVDQIAPVIHEWTYDALCHDLLNLEGNKYILEVPSRKGGPPQIREFSLDEYDPVWLELRHAHIADASERLHEKVAGFVSKNKAAHIQHVPSCKDGEPSLRNLREMVQALPDYSQQMNRLSLHVEIAGKINGIIMETGLQDTGKLEQDLVFGDAGVKDGTNFFTKNEAVSRENKLRLLMILAAIYPEKFNAKEGLDLIRKRAARKDRAGPEGTPWKLSRFYPMTEELIEKLGKGELSKDEYPCINEPCKAYNLTRETASTHSRRTPTWARSQFSNDSDSRRRHTSTGSEKMGQRIFVFIVGGATRSELRVCHKLTKKLHREVVIGSSSLDDPSEYLLQK